MKNRTIRTLGVAALSVAFSAYAASTLGTANDAAAKAARKTVVDAASAAVPGAASATSSGAVPGSKAGSAAACNTEAYVVDPDPRGLNVRESPGVGGKIIAVIPADTDGTTVHLVASDSKGWVQIDRAETIDGRVVFDKRGWVSGNMLGISTRGYGTRGVKVYATAGARKAVGMLPPEAEVKVAGCAGERMQVKYGKLTGWLDPDSQCPNPVTTCN